MVTKTKGWPSGERKRPANATPELMLQLHDKEGFTMQQIGDMFNHLSRSEVSRLIKKARAAK